MGKPNLKAKWKKLLKGLSKVRDPSGSYCSSLGELVVSREIETKEWGRVDRKTQKNKVPRPESSNLDIQEML